MPDVVQAKVLVQRAVLAKVNSGLFEAGKEAGRRARIDNAAPKLAQLHLPDGSIGKQVVKFALPEVQNFMRPFPADVKEVLLSMTSGDASSSEPSQFVKINNAFVSLDGLKRRHPELEPVLSGWIMREAIHLMNPDERAATLASLQSLRPGQDLPLFLKDAATLEAVKGLLQPPPESPAAAD